MWVAKLGKFLFCAFHSFQGLGRHGRCSGVVSEGELRNFLAFVWADLEFKNDFLEYVLYGI